MKKLFVFCLAAIMCLSVVALAGAAAKSNPYDNRFEAEARAERQPGVAKNVFVVFDENDNMRKDTFTIFYRDSSGQQKEMTSVRGKVYINFTSPNYLHIGLLQIGDVNYEFVGDNYEDFDAEDIRQGDVNYYVLKINRSEKLAYIYDAD